MTFCTYIGPNLMLLAVLPFESRCYILHYMLLGFLDATLRYPRINNQNELMLRLLVVHR